MPLRTASQHPTLQPETSCTCYCSCFRFLSRMPAIPQVPLVSKKDLSITQLAELAELADDITLSQATLNNIVAEAETTI